MKLLAEFSGEATQKPSIAEAILKSGVAVDIERAQIEGDYGWTLLFVEEKDAEKFISALEAPGITIKIQKNAVVYNPDECVDCGLCISICQKEVFSFDKDWKLCLDADRCVLCGRCAAFCPQRALSVERDA
ncbi:MAG TPA: 4Fe-4S binding protein [Methanocorpusculum sp.]|nr:4Fe-4S binding protein [Methanocorpusculum sp.]